MKIARMFAAAGFVLASLGASTLADAQSYRGDRYEHSRDDRGDRHDHRDNDRYNRGEYRHDNGNHYGWRNGRGNHQRCYVEYRHHRRVTICR